MNDINSFVIIRRNEVLQIAQINFKNKIIKFNNQRLNKEIALFFKNKIFLINRENIEK